MIVVGIHFIRLHPDFLQSCIIFYLVAFVEQLIIQAFDSRTSSIRELMRQVRTPRYSKANPRLKVDINIHNTYHAPIAKFNFIDGSEVCIS
jgi:39S ribosomal protein L53/MRP-L53